MKFLYYFGRHGEQLLTEHTPHAWECLKKEMEEDNRVTFEQAVEEWGEDCLSGSLEYSDNAHVSMDDGGEIRTLWLTEVDRSGLVK